MFCRVSRFRARMGLEDFTELTESVSSEHGVWKPHINNSQKFRVLWLGLTEPTEVPGRYKNVVARAPRVLWLERAELSEVPSTGMEALHHSKKFRARYRPSASTLLRSARKNNSLKLAKRIQRSIRCTAMGTILRTLDSLFCCCCCCCCCYCWLPRFFAIRAVPTSSETTSAVTGIPPEVLHIEY